MIMRKFKVKYCSGTQTIGIKNPHTLKGWHNPATMVRWVINTYHFGATPDSLPGGANGIIMRKIGERGVWTGHSNGEPFIITDLALAVPVERNKPPKYKASPTPVSPKPKGRKIDRSARAR